MPDEIPEDAPTLLERLKKIPGLIKEDETLKRPAIVQLLISFFSMATPFYSIYALSRLGADESLLGLFLSSQMLGRLASSFIWGHLANKGLNKQIIQSTGLMFTISPILAVVIGTQLLPYDFVQPLILLIFFLIGASMGGVMLGFNNYVLDVSDSKKRPLLLGFLNSLNVMTSILPLIGGVIIEFFPYETIFIGSAVPIGLGLIYLRNLQHKIDY
jgi:MFS family permease